MLHMMLKTAATTTIIKELGEFLFTAICSVGKTHSIYKSTCIQVMYATFDRIM